MFLFISSAVTFRMSGWLYARFNLPFYNRFLGSLYMFFQCSTSWVQETKKVWVLYAMRQGRQLIFADIVYSAIFHLFRIIMLRIPRLLQNIRPTRYSTSQYTDKAMCLIGILFLSLHQPTQPFNLRSKLARRITSLSDTRSWYLTVWISLVFFSLIFEGFKRSFRVMRSENENSCCSQYFSSF